MNLDRRTALARLPWAGLLAVLALFALDRTAFGLHDAWMALSRRDPFGVGPAQMAFLDSRREEKQRPRVLAVGPSRVFDGFAAHRAQGLLPGWEVWKAAHPRFDPFVIRCLVPQVLAAEPDLVVFLWSELDTHRPLRLEPVPGSSAASVGAVWDLVQAAGWGFAVEQRQTLYRLVASVGLGGYRYRTALFQAGLDERRRFALDARLKPRFALPRIFGEIVYWGAEPRVVSREDRAELLASFGPDANPRFVDLSIDFAAEITAGPHVALQRSFVTRTFELLRAAGVEVLVVEAPLHPLAPQVYDAGLRADFLEFMSRSVSAHGIRFVPLEELPPFEAGDFKDLLHTHGTGTVKLTDGVVEAIRALRPSA